MLLHSGGDNYLDENTIGCAHACPDHDSCGSGEPQGTGARDHQHGDAKEQSEQEVVVALRQPLRGKHAAAASHIPAPAPRPLRSEPMSRTTDAMNSWIQMLLLVRWTSARLHTSQHRPQDMTSLIVDTDGDVTNWHDCVPGSCHMQGVEAPGSSRKSIRQCFDCKKAVNDGAGVACSFNGHAPRCA